MLKIWSKYSDVPIKYEQAFLGKCFGVILKKREARDPHVCFMVIVEDDGNWLVSENGGSSSWFPDLIQQLTIAHEWCKENCDPDISKDNGRQYGWRFR